MAILNGDKIEKLLWNNGLDFEHREIYTGTYALRVWCGSAVVDVTEAWQDVEDWYLDGESLVFLVQRDGSYTEDYTLVASETDLVEHLASYGE